MVDRNEYPFESRFFERNGLKMHFVDEGQGDPVLMVHGNPTWSFYYRNLIKDLSKTHRVVAPDHIGCGLSDKPGDDLYDYRFKSRVDDLEALVDSLGLGNNLTLVLHDWGGMIGMGFAVRRHKSIKRLVLLNTAAFMLPESKRFPAALWLCRNTPLGGFLVRRFNAFALAASHVCVKQHKMSRKLRHAYREPYDNWKNRIATLRFVQDIPLNPGDPSWDACKEVESNLHLFKDTPTVIFWGALDFVFSVEFLEEWKKYLPNALVHFFPDRGHYILEDAQEEVIAGIHSFFDKHPIDEGSVR